MTTRAWGAEYRTTTVCVDSYEKGVLQGRFYNPYLSGGQGFQSMTQFLLGMEQALDGMDFPKSFTAARTFSVPPEHETGPPEQEFRPGKKATFAVRVLFRQNASWQGSVTWLEGKREQSFRSVLELVVLMDSALNSAPSSTEANEKSA